ncbi:hydrolase, partial [Oryctes borbonicus]
MSAEKECTSSGNPLEKRPVILLDIAGTITSHGFLKDTLYPYAAAHLEEYVKTNWDEQDIKTLVKHLSSGEEALPLEKVVEKCKTIINTQYDKPTPVQNVQEATYKKGFEDGSLVAHIFPDVPEALENWSKTKRIAIFSKGNVESQKQLIAHTTSGDLSKYISHYFDLSVGGKTDDASYTKIAEQLSIAPEELIYINDQIDEANAAKKAGITAILVKREGNKEIPEADSADFTILASFADHFLEMSGKRKNEEPETPEAPPPKVAKTEIESTSRDNATSAQKTEEQKVEIAAEAMEVDSEELVKEEEAKPAEVPQEPTTSSKTEELKETRVTEETIADEDIEMVEETKITKAPEETAQKVEITTKPEEKVEEKPQEE